MNVAQKLKTLLEEAELYRKQSLLAEAQDKYAAAVSLLEAHEHIKGRDSLLEKIQKRIDSLQKNVEKIRSASAAPQISKEIQDLILDKFSFATDSNEKALEGAIALAKFGQYERALAEFNALLQTDSHRMVAAKNIARCFVSLADYTGLISQFHHWIDLDVFAENQLENLKVFVQGMLTKKGVDAGLLDVRPEEPASVPEPEPAPEPTLDTFPEPAPIGVQTPIIEMPETGEEEGVQEADLIDVSSVGIVPESGPQKGQFVELDVSFQSGKKISLIISAKRKDLLEVLKKGAKLKEVQFFSPFAMFTGSCIVTSHTKIGTGPKRGDFSIDLNVL